MWEKWSEGSLASTIASFSPLCLPSNVVRSSGWMRGVPDRSWGGSLPAPRRPACQPSSPTHLVPPSCPALHSLLPCLQAELAKIQSPLQRAQRLAVYARIFAAELLGTVLAAPFGLRAFTLHRSLPDTRQAGQRAGTVSILRDVR